MSLLLDALKKAALEKQRREQSTTNKPAVAHLSAVTDASTSVARANISLSDKLSIETLETKTPSVELINEPPPEKEAGALSPERDLAKSETHPEPQGSETAAEFLDIDLDAITANDSPIEVPLAAPIPAPLTASALDDASKKVAVAEQESVHKNDAQKTQEEDDSSHTEKTMATSVDVDATANVEAPSETTAFKPASAHELNKEQAISQFDSTAGKDALNQLLKSSTASAKKVRTRMLGTYLALMLIAMVVVFQYYFVVSNRIANSQNNTLVNAANLIPSTNEAAMTTDLDLKENAVVAALPTTINIPDEAKAPTTISATENTKVTSPQPTNESLILKPASTTKSLVKKAEPTNTQKNQNLSSAKNSARPTIIRHNESIGTLNAAVQRGYQAYQQGDYATAKLAYAEALAEDPNLGDALLGAAAVAAQLQQHDEALRYLQQRLARAPKDQYAQAGILALTTNAQSDPRFDSELSRLLREYPAAAHLHFLRGSVYAARQQWGAAQLSFFEAWQLDNKNPNYAFNLAVALDHLQTPKEALRFYQTALALRDNQALGFAVDAAIQRVQQLEKLAQ